MPNFPFAKTQRLLKPAEFKLVLDARTLRSYDHLFTLIAQPNELGYPRLGLAIAKKQLRFSPQRNRLKRLIRESFRHEQHKLPALDIVVMVRKAVQDEENSTLRDKLAQHWRQLNKRAAKFTPNTPIK